MAITISFSEQQKKALGESGAMAGIGTKVFTSDGSEIYDIVSIDIRIRSDEIVYATLVVAVDSLQQTLSCPYVRKKANILGKLKYKFIGFLKRSGIISYT
jgi:hypothetical protein